MKGKTKENFKNWIDVKERIPNGYFISKVFEKYYLYKFNSSILKEESECVPSTYNIDKQIVDGGYNDGQAKQKISDKKIEADLFIAKVDKVMKHIEEEENFYYKMIDSYYRNDIKHKKIANKLGYKYYIDNERRRYYRDWDKAVSYFVKQALNRNINVI